MSANPREDVAKALRDLGGSHSKYGVLVLADVAIVAYLKASKSVRAGDLVEIISGGEDCPWRGAEERVDAIVWDAENQVEKARIIHHTYPLDDPDDESVYYDLSELKVIKAREEH